MNWRLWKWKDVAAFLLVIGLIAGLVVMSERPWGPRTNHGFGPEWECRAQPQGDPICAKKREP